MKGTLIIWKTKDMFKNVSWTLAQSTRRRQMLFPLYLQYDVTCQQMANPSGSFRTGHFAVLELALGVKTSTLTYRKA